jgi:hypothetical protein
MPNSVAALFILFILTLLPLFQASLGQVIEFMAAGKSTTPTKLRNSYKSVSMRQGGFATSRRHLMPLGLTV